MHDRSIRSYFGLFLWVLMATVVQAGEKDPGQRVPAGSVPRTGTPVVVDGVLDDPAWRDALELELRYETSPGENVDPPARTACKFSYDDAHLYVGCNAIDADPQAIRARLSDRDTAWSDDFVGVVLDTFNDERRAFEFFVNPLGVQMDLIQDDVAGSEDSSWDAIWDSAGKITDEGYIVEMAIPFSSLRFQRGEGDQTWGLDVVRIYPRDRRVRIGLNALDRDVSCYLCQASKVVGFAGAQPGKNLEVTPTLTAIRSESIDSFPDGGLGNGSTEFEPGVTARWGVTPNLALGGTLNPDFSQVEADAARLAINQEFALFFPEKRPFFLEGADFFETPISASYTRTVADPAWGAKLTGKEGRNALGAYVAQDDRTNLLFPGSEGSSLDSIDDKNLSGVFRYRRDIGESSAIGSILTAREGDNYHNRVFGFDTLLRPTEADTIRLQMLGSQTDYPDSIDSAGDLEDTALSFSYRHDTRNWLARMSYNDFGEDFRADLGFVPQVDFSKLIVGGGYTWYGDSDQWFSRLELGGDWDETKNQDGELIEREVEGSFVISAGRQSLLVISSGQRTRVFEGVTFDQSYYYSFFEFRPTVDLYVNFDIDYGDRIDFAFDSDVEPARQGKRLQMSPGLRYNFGKHLNVNVNHVFSRLELPSGDRPFKANLTELRLVYQFNVRSFLRIITQYEALRLDPDLIAPGDPRKRRDLFNQVLFSYKLNPQTALYVGYTDDRSDSFDGMTATALTQTGRTIFVKVGYAWVP